MSNHASTNVQKISTPLQAILTGLDFTFFTVGTIGDETRDFFIVARPVAMARLGQI